MHHNRHYPKCNNKLQKKPRGEVYFVHEAHAIVNLKPFESRSSALLLCS